MGQEHPLEKRIATHSGILSWRNPWTEEPTGYTVCGVTKSQVGMTDQISVCLKKKILCQH